MIRVFIYHENSDLLQIVRQTVVECFRSMKHSFQVTSCTKYKEAAEYIKKSCERDDIFLFDFSDHKKAIRLAAYLRGHNIRASWVCLGGKAEDVFRALLTRPSGYIQDPEDSESIRKLIETLGEQHRKIEKAQYFSFKYEGEFTRLPYDEISYFESSGKKAALYQVRSDKCYYFTAKLDDIETVLPDHFLRCHQSYIVNMHMIRCMDTRNHVFILYSNEEIPISRRMYNGVKELYEKLDGAELPIFP